MIFLALGGTFMAYKYILHPAYLSVYFVCYNPNIEELQERGYTITGIYKPSTDEIILYHIDSKVWKHENIHSVQYKQNRLDTCDNPIKLYIDELEAYFGQYLPDFIYERVYSNN